MEPRGPLPGAHRCPAVGGGLEQVHRLGARLGGVHDRCRDRVAALARAATAEAILDAPATHATLELELESGLMEISHGAWEGQLATEVELVARRDVRRVARTRPAATCRPGPARRRSATSRRARGRCSSKVFGRVGDRARRSIAAHDAVNRVILCRVLGLPLARVWKFRQAPAALNVLRGRDALGRAPGRAA